MVGFVALFLSYLFTVGSCFSACDDVNIGFFIDDSSAATEADFIKQLISSIILHSSSEHAAFSAAVYGNIHEDETRLLFDIHSTSRVTNRFGLNSTVSDILDTKLDDIIIDAEAGSSTSNGGSYGDSLVKSFFTMRNQTYSKRPSGRKSEILSRNVGLRESTQLGGRDDHDIYFIFDYDANLMATEEISHLCRIMMEEETDEALSIHILVAPERADEVKKQIIGRCGLKMTHSRYTDYISKSMVIPLQTDLISDAREFGPWMENNIYHLTCPAWVVSDDGQKSGRINLGNHVQWFDTDTLVTCELKMEPKTKNHSVPTNQLTRDSFVVVKDYEDGNTFKRGDYLIADPSSFDVIKTFGCFSPVYRIESLTRLPEDDHVKMSVSLPRSPMEYLSYLKTSNLANDLNDLETSDLVTLKANKQYNQYERRRMFIVLDGKTEDFVLSDVTFSDSLELEWDVDDSVAVFGTGPSLSFGGDGTITIGFDYLLKFFLSLDYTLYWDVFSDDQYLYYALFSDTRLFVDFDLSYEGTITISIDDLVSWRLLFAFFVGPVPVVVAPFISMSGSVTTTPISVHTGIECGYNETSLSGYEYNHDTTFVAAYGLLDEDYTFTLTTTIATWSEVTSLETCVKLNYEYGAGSGFDCVWFTYEASAQECVCFGNGVIVGAMLQSKTGTNAYIINRQCGAQVRNQLLCGFLFFLYEDGDGISNDVCIDCPIFQTNQGYATEITTSRNISEVYTKESYCTPHFEVDLFSSADSDETTCDASVEIGFDTSLEVKLGLGLYELISFYGKTKVTVPFRLNAPEFDYDVCDDFLDVTDVNLFVNASDDDCCSDTTKLLASFTASVELAFSFGIALELNLLDAIYTIINILTDNIDAQDDYTLVIPLLEVLVAEFEVLPKTVLTCIPLDGLDLLISLNEYLKDECCTSDVCRFGPTSTQAAPQSTAPIATTSSNNNIESTGNTESMENTDGAESAESTQVIEVTEVDQIDQTVQSTDVMNQNTQVRQNIQTTQMMQNTDLSDNEAEDKVQTNATGTFLMPQTTGVSDIETSVNATDSKDNILSDTGVRKTLLKLGSISIIFLHLAALIL